MHGQLLRRSITHLTLAVMLCGGCAAAATAQTCDYPPQTATDSTGSQTQQEHTRYAPVNDCTNQCQKCKNQTLPALVCKGGAKNEYTDKDTKTQTSDFSLTLGTLFKLISGDLKRSTTETWEKNYVGSVTAVDLTAPQDTRVVQYAAKTWYTEVETRTDANGHTGGRSEQDTDTVWGQATEVMGSLQSFDMCTKRPSGPDCPAPQ